jgi:steroid delta-isomerase
MSQNAKVTAVNNYLKALNEKDMSIIEALYADNAVVHDPYGVNKVEGIEAIKGFYQYAFDANVTGELTGPVRVSGDSAAFSFCINFQGDIIDVIDVFEFNDDDKVVQMKAYWSEDNKRK